MKGKIDKDGNLYLERTDVMRKQYCHHQSNFESGYGVECGDWCPLFKYNETNWGYDSIHEGKSTKKMESGWLLDLCHQTHHLTELEVENESQD